MKFYYTIMLFLILSIGYLAELCPFLISYPSDFLVLVGFFLLISYPVIFYYFVKYSINQSKKEILN